MKLSLKTSGGIGNIQLQGQIDTDELPSDLAERVRTVLTPEHLAAAHSAVMGPVADAMQYEIGLFLDGGLQTFQIDDVHAPPGVLDIVQELVQRVIDQKRARP
jgi:hypothetical protein